ncbi:aminotransferase class I/II-fold pyridoxal phosphate-dependent enzyme [archaeon]|nr:MAG: aminotransferase class I/II-fold pyridoxal phosphate-dependent enzyme [archaeon]
MHSPAWGCKCVCACACTHLRVCAHVRARSDACSTTENIKSCLNLSSYNYLGFADDWHTTCKADVEKVAREYPVSTCTSFAQGGYTALHSKLEETVARYVGKESSMIFNMGYATNFLGIPALISKGCLILSDSLNHASIVNGARSSGATIRVFKHNDPANLERLLRHAIIEGQERTRLRWRKILVMVRWRAAVLS